MNFFPRYYGKKAEDGNFGVLNRWFIKGELVERAGNIEDLMSYFIERYLDTGIDSSQFTYHQFTPEPIGRTFKKLKIKDFNMYLLFLIY
jgi:hypothetical protein